MNIRNAAVADLAAVEDIYSQIHSAEESGLAMIGWKRGIYPTAMTAEQALDRGDLFVQEDDGKIVGAGIINHQQVDAYSRGNWRYAVSEEEVMVLHTLVISPSAAKKGYGRSFVEFYENYARSQGCRYVRMDTNEKNANARALYKKWGYIEAGIVPCAFNGIEGVYLVLLEKML